MVSKLKKAEMSDSIADSLIKQVSDFHKIQVAPREIFANYYNGTGTSLTKRGFELIMPILTLYPININLSFKVYSTKSKILLARAMKYPYFVEKGKIWVSNSEDAFLLNLYTGDIEAWAESAGIKI
jgi:hypothetical protein